MVHGAQARIRESLGFGHHGLSLDIDSHLSYNIYILTNGVYV
jgi:hypothetical protein